MSAILVLTGLLAAVIGAWRGYASAREALGPLVHDGEPTRTALEASRPLLVRPRVRHFARRVGVAITWLGVALYGLFLLSVGLEVAG